MWQAFIDLMLNFMVLLYQGLGNNFILALVAFTVITRLILLPLNLRQQKTSIRMQEMQPQVQAIQKKYKGDQAKMMEELQKIGYNPAEPLLGCLPLLIQMPIFLALFRVITIMLESTPLALVELKTKIWPAFDLATLFPIDNTFLWMNLAVPDPYLVLPILVAGTMFLQQKLMMPPTTDKDKKKGAQPDNPMASTQQSMLYTMPIMFGFFAMSFNSGLAIYFVVSNIIGIGQGYITQRNMAKVRAENEARKKGEPEKVLEAETEASANGSEEKTAASSADSAARKEGKQSKRSRKKKSN